MIIDTILKNDNYAASEWLKRGLNPSPDDVITLMSSATSDFLLKLKEISSEVTEHEEREELVSELVDALPWYDLDTEEKEFLADVLAPAIESLGLDPWSIF